MNVFDHALTSGNGEDFRSAQPGPLKKVRDVSFGEDASTSRTGKGPTNLATLRSSIKAAIKDAGYLHVPEDRRDHTTVTETLYLHGLIT